MSASDEHRSALRDWIASATNDLTGAASARLAEEYEDHYGEAYDAALASGLSEEEAHGKAMAALGDPRASHLAAIPVHGDPYRLRVKGALAVVGILLVMGSLYYKGTLMKLGDYDGYRLWKAVEAGDLEAMKEQLDAGVSPEAVEPSPILPVVLSRDYEGDRVLDIVELLLERGVDPNRMDTFGRTALYYTIYGDKRPEGHFQNLKLNRSALFDMLVEYGAEVEHQSTVQEWTLMEYASYFGDPLIVEKLRALGVEESPEALIYQERYDDVIAWAEREPAILTTGYLEGSTIPQLLVSRGRMIEFKQALELGGDLKHLDDKGRSVLHYAFTNPTAAKSSESTFELLVYLLELGCDVHQQDTFGATPLHYAAALWSEKEVKLLLGYGADPNLPSKKNETGLHAALRVGNEKTASTLIDAGADVNAQDEDLFTPLHYAVNGRLLDSIRKLVERGASLEAVSADGDRPIHVAAVDRYSHEHYSVDSPETLALLLDLGADINARSSNGRTALYHAKANHNLEIMRCLLEHGADVMIPDKRGFTALHTDTPGIVALLREFGYEPMSDDEKVAQP